MGKKLIALGFFIFWINTSFAQGRQSKPQIIAPQSKASNRLVVAFKESNNISVNGNQSVLIRHSGQNQLLKSAKLKNSKALKKPSINTRTTQTQIPILLEFETGADITEIKSQLEASGLYEYVEPDFKIHTHGEEGGITPNDTHYENRQWSHHNDGTFNANSIEDADSDINLAWTITTGSNAVTVAILDTGIKPDHPEMAGRFWINNLEIDGNATDDDGNGFIDDIYGWDFINDDNDPTDDHGHGTNVAGIIGANGNNNEGYAGVDWNCNLMHLKVLDADGSGFYSQFIEGIYYAVDHGANVLNLSLGGSAFSLALEDAVNYAYLNNVVLVVSMGNNDSEIPSYPAAFDNVIAVGASDTDNSRVSPFSWNINSGSNYGDHIDIIAPGHYMYGLSHTSNTNYNSFWGGTSQAAPMVTGVVALLRDLAPGISVDSIRSLLHAGAVDYVGDPSEDIPGWDQFHGYGVLNGYNSLLYLAPPDTLIYGETCGTYDFNGEMINASGTFLDTLINEFGADSVIMLSLTIHPEFDETVDILTANPFVFDGVELTESGTYDAAFLSVSGCDSLVTLNLTIQELVATTCEEALVLDDTGDFSVDNSFEEQWFSYVSPQEGILEVSTCLLTTEDTWIEIFEGSCGNLLVSSDDDCALQSKIQFSADLNEIYYFRFRNDFNNAVFTANLSFIDTEMTGLTCQNPMAIQPGIHQVDNTTSGKWYRFTAPTDGSLTVESCNTTDEDTYLELFSDCDTQIVWQDDNCGDWQETVTINNLVPDEEIIIYWGDNYQHAVYDFELIFTPDDPDYCENFDNDTTLNIEAINFFEFDGNLLTDNGTYFANLTSSKACDSLVTLNLTIIEVEGYTCEEAIAIPAVGTYTADNTYGDQWFVYSAEQSGTLVVSTCGLPGNDDTYIMAFNDCGQIDIAADNNSCGVKSRLVIDDAALGNSYLIAFKGDFTDGSYNFQIGFQEEQGYNCENPTEALLGLNTVTNALGSQFFYYVVPLEGELSISTCNLATVDTYIRVYDDNCQLMEENDNFCSEQSELTLNGLSPGEILIFELVDANAVNQYQFELTFAESPLVGVCDVIIPLNAAGDFAVNNAPGDQWYSFTSDETGKLFVSTYGLTTENTFIEIYQGTCDNLNLVVANDDFNGEQSMLGLGVNSGETYFIKFDDEHTQSSFTANLTLITEGLSCNNPVTATIGNNPVNNLFGDNWFVFTLPTDGMLQIYSCNATSEDTELTVFSACNNQVEYSDDDCGTGQSDVTIDNGQAGQTYFFSWSDEKTIGSYNFNLDFIPENCDYDELVNVSSCFSYEFNGNVFTQSGIYSEMFTSTLGCDSLVTINLNILNDRDEICRELTTGMEDLKGNAYIKLYPSPTYGALSIDLGTQLPLVNITVLNNVGQIVYRENVENTSMITTHIPGPPGVYTIKLSTNQDEYQILRVIKE